jgi:DNA-binding NtrC family response regulator
LNPRSGWEPPSRLSYPLYLISEVIEILNMNERKYQILIIDDDGDLLEFYIRKLQEHLNDCDLRKAKSLKEARSQMTQYDFDVVLTDLKLRTADQGGLTILNEVKRRNPYTQVIVFSGIGGTEDARQAERLNVDGYLTKPLDFDQVHKVVRNAIGLKSQLVEAHGSVLPLPAPERIVYTCKVMSDLWRNATRLADGTQNILIRGEPGTGKGLLAEEIHFGSNRKAFELVNCGSLSERALEGIIFGRDGEAESGHQGGLLERLSEGTLVLDRVASLSLRLQEKLISALHPNYDMPSKHSKASRSKVRLIAIDEFEVDIALKHRLFLRELYTLLAAETLLVPPLRERFDPDGKYNDVLVLVEHFLRKYGEQNKQLMGIMPTLSHEVETIFEVYPFPGNVRELEQTILLALTKAEDNQIHINHLPLKLRKYGGQLTLGAPTENADIKLQCPHGSFYCNQVGAIYSAYHNSETIYLSLPSEFGAIQLRELQNYLAGFGKRAIVLEEVFNPLTSMCNICVPIQSSRFAIVDFKTDPQTAYQLGLLHAMGIPTLLLKHVNQTVPSAFSATNIVEYSHVDELKELISTWLL